MKRSNHSGAMFSLLAVLLVASIVLLHLMGQAVIRANRRLLSDQAVLERLHDTLSTIKDAETGQRGFVLTGNETYLAPYLQAQHELADELNMLRRDGERAELDPNRVNDLTFATGNKMAELEQTVELRRTKGFDAAVAIVENNSGKSFMDDIRRLIHSLADDERTAIASEARQASRWEWYRTIGFTIITAFDLAFLWWAYRRLKAESTAKEIAAIDVLRQKNLLGVTLSSIGDAVIVTDAAARIVFINGIAEALTGWTGGSAIGHACSEVFHIINEQSRQIVDSPVDKVLATGHVVGLANHTLLIRRDKSEVPIDDSGSPVRDADGNVHGVVLIFRDFTNHRDATNRLIKAMTELEAANKAKDRFVAMISHELRTPLTPVLGTLTSWEMDETLPAPLRNDLKMMQWNVELEARLIDDLLDLTRINAGKLSLKLETADVHTYLHAVLKIFQREIEEKQLQIDLELQADRHFARCDAARLQQVFWNILKNSSKFTAKKGSIKISTENLGEYLLVKFTDSGIGMSADTLARIFQPFEQGNVQITQHFGGLGLGLTISKELAEAHQGTLQASSDGLGQGSTFTVTLPTVETPTPSQPVVAPAAGAAPARRALKVLLVEDHADTATVISLLLKKFGHTTDIAGTVAGGVELFKTKGPYEILLSDLGLPDGTGLDFIKTVRETSQIPAVALTGYGMDEDVARCKEAGFNAHLTKPINFNELETLIRQLT